MTIPIVLKTVNDTRPRLGVTVKALGQCQRLDFPGEDQGFPHYTQM